MLQEMNVNNAWIQIIIKDPLPNQSQHKTLKKLNLIKKNNGKS